MLVIITYLSLFVKSFVPPFGYVGTYSLLLGISSWLVVRYEAPPGLPRFLIGPVCGGAAKGMACREPGSKKKFILPRREYANR